MVRIGIIGHTGRLGRPLVELLNGHPQAEIVFTESRKEGQNGNIDKAELIFLALPKGESAQYLSRCERKRIIDLSEDHRTAMDWVYGLPELNKSRIELAQKVANPGCYATSIILGLLPIKDYIEQVSIASTSGISGAGLSPTKEDNFLIYNEGNIHSHLKEINAVINSDKNSTSEILFVPQRIDNTDRGIISTIFCNYHGHNLPIDEYQKFYQNHPFIRLADTIETKAVNGTNSCHIKIQQFDNGRMIIVSTLDNIIKGGSGQAVQNFNLMYGFDEKTGLKTSRLN